MKGGNSTLAHISGQVGTRAHQPTSLQSAGQSVATKARVSTSTVWPYAMFVCNPALSQIQHKPLQSVVLIRATLCLQGEQRSYQSTRYLDRCTLLVLNIKACLQVIHCNSWGLINWLTSSYLYRGTSCRATSVCLKRVMEASRGIVLVYGNYPDMWSAKTGVKKNCRWCLRRQHPWVKSFKTIEQEVKQHRVLS